LRPTVPELPDVFLMNREYLISVAILRDLLKVCVRKRLCNRSYRQYLETYCLQVKC